MIRRGANTSGATLEASLINVSHHLFPPKKVVLARRMRKNARVSDSSFILTPSIRASKISSVVLNSRK